MLLRLALLAGLAGTAIAAKTEKCGENGMKCKVRGSTTGEKVCVYDFDKNPNYCGNCKTQCTGTQVCANGYCQETRCKNSYFAPCGGAKCADLRTDAKNCGRCSNACPNGGTCRGGSCCAFPRCPDGSCKDLNRDRSNCGACGRACEDSEFCQKGVCCNNVLCDGVCKDYENDPNNCGYCGNVCASGGCQHGQCCRGDVCGGKCTNTLLDPQNCGSCGNDCGAGSCLYDSDITGVYCCEQGSEVCRGSCKNFASDPSNCGYCGNACLERSETCEGGTCTTRPETLCVPGRRTVDGTCYDIKCNELIPFDDFLAERTGINIDDCAQQCSQTERCVAAALQKNYELCYLWANLDGFGSKEETREIDSAIICDNESL